MPARDRPRCASSPIGAPTSSRSSRRAAAATDITGSRRDGFDFQNLHRNKRSLAINLKTKEGLAIFMKLAAKADVIVENFRSNVKHRLGIDYEIGEEDQPAHRLRQHLRLRPDRALRQAARRRPDRPGHGRPDVDHRLAGPGAGARRHPDRRSLRRPAAGAGDHDGADRAREDRRGAVGAHLAARGADLHARLPGLALAAWPARSPSRPATTTRPASRPACSRPRTGRSTSPPRATISTSVLRGGRGAASADRSGLRDRTGALEEPQEAQRDDRRGHQKQAERLLDRAAERGRRAVRARCTPSTRRSTTRRCSTSRWRGRWITAGSATSRSSARRST